MGIEFLDCFRGERNISINPVLKDPSQPRPEILEIRNFDAIEIMKIV